MKKNISILLISMGSGGAEKFVSLMLPRLIKDYNVHLILFTKNNHFNIPKEVNVVILDNDTNEGFFKKIILFPKLLYRYHKYLKSNTVDISLSLLTRPNLINSLTHFFNPKAKTVISERCYPSKAYRSSKFRYHLYSLLIPLIYNKADHLFSNSVEINKDLQENFSLNIPCSVIYNPVLQPETKINSNALSSEFTIICVGSMYPIKNQSLLIQAFKNIDFKAKLSLLGDGRDRKMLENLTCNLSIGDKVNFFGKVKNVNDYLLKSHCFVLPSNSEGFPNVLIEAMAVGLPVISTMCKSGPLEILNENRKVEISKGQFYKAKYGLLINVGDTEALTKAINFFKDEYDMWLKYSRLSSQRAAYYNVDRIYSELHALLSYE